MVKNATVLEAQVNEEDVVRTFGEEPISDFLLHVLKGGAVRAVFTRSVLTKERSRDSVPAKNDVLHHRVVDAIGLGINDGRISGDWSGMKVAHLHGKLGVVHVLANAEQHVGETIPPFCFVDDEQSPSLVKDENVEICAVLRLKRLHGNFDETMNALDVVGVNTVFVLELVLVVDLPEVDEFGESRVTAPAVGDNDRLAVKIGEFAESLLESRCIAILQRTHPDVFDATVLIKFDDTHEPAREDANFGTDVVFALAKVHLVDDKLTEHFVERFILLTPNEAEYFVADALDLIVVEAGVEAHATPAIAAAKRFEDLEDVARVVLVLGVILESSVANERGETLEGEVAMTVLRVLFRVLVLLSGFVVGRVA